VSRNVVLVGSVYYMLSDVTVEGDRITPCMGAVPRDGTGRELDEPTIDDRELSCGALAVPAPVSCQL